MPLPRFIAFAWLLLLIAGSGRAFAQSPSTTGFENDDRAHAKELFSQGESAYGDKDFARALSFYKQAFAAWPLPGFQFNIGQCHRQMGQFAPAIAAFQLYLEQSPKAPNRKAVRALLKTCQRELARHPTPPTEVVEAEPPKVEDVAPIAETPPPVKTEEPARIATPAPDLTIHPTPELATPELARPLSPTWFWLATASTGVFAGAAVVTGAMALSRNHEFKDSATSDSQRQNDKRTGQSLQTATNVGLVCSGVSAITAVVLWKLTYGRSPSDGASVAWVPGGALLTHQGRF